MWAFCRNWLWNENGSFLSAEQYSITGDDRTSILMGLCELAYKRFLARGSPGACHLSSGVRYVQQAADLHSIWKFHLLKQRFHALGQLSFTACGYPIWVKRNGRLYLWPY